MYTASRECSITDFDLGETDISRTTGESKKNSASGHSLSCFFIELKFKLSFWNQRINCISIHLLLLC